MVEPFAFLMPVRQLQTFFTPQTFDPLVIDMPAFGAQQFADFSVAIPAILFGQPDQGQAQIVIILEGRLVV